MDDSADAADGLAAHIDFAAWETDPVAVLLAALRARHADVLAAHPALGARLDAHVPTFWAEYAALYGSAYDQLGELTRLFDALVDGHARRRADLRRRDRMREADPAWFQDPRYVGMMLYVDLFAGDLRGVRARIPYLQELGITYLHLMPLLKPREGPNDGGYAVADYRAVDPRLGTMDDLRALADALHEAGIVLVIDFVMNHTAREHPWAQAALAGDARFQGYYRLFPDRALPDAYEASLPEVFPDFAPGSFTFEEQLGQWVWTTFYPFQWDLNYTNPEVFRAVLGEMLFLANLGVDGLRLDAVPFLWKQMGTNCQNQEGAHRLLRAYRALMRIAAPGVLFKSEAIVAPEEIVRYLGTGGHAGKACDLGYHAALMCHLWHALAAENTQLLTTMLANLSPPPEEASWLTYVRCHDDIGWGIADEDAAQVGQSGPATRRWLARVYAGEEPPFEAEGYRFQEDAHTGEARTSGTAAALTGLQRALVEGSAAEVDRAVQRFLLLHHVVFIMKGLPLLYSGDELGQLNDLSYLLDPLKAADNRWVHRPPMDWAKAERRHTPGTVEHRLFHALQRFAAVRRTCPALHGRAHERVLATGKDRLFVVERARGEAGLLAVANVSGTAQALPLGVLPTAWRGGVYRDLLAEAVVQVCGDALWLPPYGYLWLAPAPEADRPAGTVRTTLRLRAETAWGEAVYLSGPTDALGDGDPSQALGPLDASAYPVWTAAVELPAGALLTLRWLTKRGDHVTGWSPRPYGVRAGDGTLHPLAGDHPDR